jgi:mannitol-specific phosphotransferase system IIBC component
MERMIFCLADSQVKKIKKIQKTTGLSMSDVVRRSIDNFQTEEDCKIPIKKLLEEIKKHEQRNDRIQL